MTLVYEGLAERTSVVRYKRCLRAIKALDLTLEESCQVLHALDYTDSKGINYQWLTKALDKQKQPKLDKELMHQVMQ